ncbi:MAG: PilZ domain-containing protein [Solirubrobacteraceae bacterium]
MAVSSVPQLHEGQSARLDVGTSLPCRVIGFSGHDVVLALQAQPPEALVAGGSGYLILEASGRLHAVRGMIAGPAGEEVVLRLQDDFRLGQRRLFSRAPLALPARLLDENGTEWSTVTRDLSAGGVCVERRGANPAAGRLELTIAAGDHDVVTDAGVVRETPAELGLRFERIERDDRLLLAALALAYHRRR